MSKPSPTNLIRGLVLGSLALTMVAGFLLLGGAGNSDSAEARCARSWFSRCTSPIAVETTEIVSSSITTSPYTSTLYSTWTDTSDTHTLTFTETRTVTGVGTIAVTTTSTQTSISVQCSRGWFSRCDR